MQLNRIVNVATAVTMPSARNIRKDRRYLGKRMALLACKLGSSGTVVDEVVVLSSGVVDGGSGVYRRLRGGERNNKYTTIIAIQMQDITDKSFKNTITTTYINNHFINIKINHKKQPNIN